MNLWSYKFCYISMPASNFCLFDQHPSFGSQLIIEVTYQLCNLIPVRSHKWMNNLTEKAQKYIGFTREKIEPLITEYPIIRPISWIVYTMLPYIVCCVAEPVII